MLDIKFPSTGHPIGSEDYRHTVKRLRDHFAEQHVDATYGFNAVLESAMPDCSFESNSLNYWSYEVILL